MARSNRNCDRDGDKAVNDTLKVLRSENRQLRKQIAQLRRQLADNEIPEDDTPQDKTPEPNKAPTHNCESCGHILVVMPLGIRTAWSCGGCGKRGTFKTKEDFLR